MQIQTFVYWDGLVILKVHVQAGMIIFIFSICICKLLETVLWLHCKINFYRSIVSTAVPELVLPRLRRSLREACGVMTLCARQQPTSHQQQLAVLQRMLCQATDNKMILQMKSDNYMCTASLRRDGDQHLLCMLLALWEFSVHVVLA